MLTCWYTDIQRQSTAWEQLANSNFRTCDHRCVVHIHTYTELQLSSSTHTKLASERRIDNLLHWTSKLFDSLVERSYCIRSLLDQTLPRTFTAQSWLSHYLSLYLSLHTVFHCLSLLIRTRVESKRSLVKPRAHISFELFSTEASSVVVGFVHKSVRVFASFVFVRVNCKIRNIQSSSFFPLVAACYYDDYCNNCSP